MTTKKKDFVEIDFTGRTEDGEVFDTSVKEVAQKQDFYNPNQKYKRLTLCIGEGNVVKGLDKSLEGKELGKTYVFKIPPEEAFGKKDSKLLQLVNTGELVKKGINPRPGLSLEVEGVICRVKTVSGGRTILDFNNPLAGQTVEYEIKISRIVEDPKEKADSVMDFAKIKFESRLDGEKLSVKTPAELPKELKEALNKVIIGSVKELKEVSFEVDEKK